ncbi:MAG: molybdenum cofactor biosynthesis protein MoaE [Deltaproteobacteria bacterium]|jgi:molybdopterin synthase catalytic subunit|nr:molybdenum cofactor biosynthesis protein MoaE [Deltaproteobacteria bacterium]
MQVMVKLFGSIREATGAEELAVPLADGSRVSALRSLLVEQEPAFALAHGELGERLRVSVNMEIVTGDPPLSDGDEVAFLPPVAGGQDDPPARCRLRDSALDVGEVVTRVAGPDVGGIVTFVGTVRNASRGKDIEHLEYEAYPGMAEREMDKICEEAAARWPGARVAVDHRAGQLEIGDIAVVVVAAAPHRPEAFAACRYTIDTLKERVPIWKKEFATDGATWVDDHA